MSFSPTHALPQSFTVPESSSLEFDWLHILSFKGCKYTKPSPRYLSISLHRKLGFKFHRPTSGPSSSGPKSSSSPGSSTRFEPISPSSAAETSPSLASSTTPSSSSCPSFGSNSPSPSRSSRTPSSLPSTPSNFLFVLNCQIVLLGCNILCHFGVLLLHFMKGGCNGIGAWVLNSVLNGAILLLFLNFYGKMHLRKGKVSWSRCHESTGGGGNGQGKGHLTGGFSFDRCILLKYHHRVTRQFVVTLLAFGNEGSATLWIGKKTWGETYQITKHEDSRPLNN